ncbi:MAG: hypothetical protein FJW95_09105 [Actinobacteria bacterium]|nr:hypothetical protein [Actinomycetota bacterium]
MYLFTRSRTIDPGELSGAMAFVPEITERVRSITGVDVQAWAAVMSPEAGLVTWSAWFESLKALEVAGDQLTADSGYMKAVEKGDDYFDGGIVDGLAQVVYGTVDPDANPAYAAVASAASTNGRLADAISGGIEIAEFASRVSGQNTLFVVGATGPYGGVAWITGNPDIETLEAGESALMADPEWLQLIDRVSPAYLPGASQTIFRRIA